MTCECHLVIHTQTQTQTETEGYRMHFSEEFDIPGQTAWKGGLIILRTIRPSHSALCGQTRIITHTK